MEHDAINDPGRQFDFMILVVLLAPLVSLACCARLSRESSSDTDVSDDYTLATELGGMTVPSEQTVSSSSMIVDEWLIDGISPAIARTPGTIDDFSILTQVGDIYENTRLPHNEGGRLDRDDNQIRDLAIGDGVIEDQNVEVVVDQFENIAHIPVDVEQFDWRRDALSIFGNGDHFMIPLLRIDKMSFAFVSRKIRQICDNLHGFIDDHQDIEIMAIICALAVIHILCVSDCSSEMMAEFLLTNMYRELY